MNLCSAPVSYVILLYNPYTGALDQSIVDGHVKLSQKWSFETEPLGN
jgi:hypothetical protein